MISDTFLIQKNCRFKELQCTKPCQQMFFCSNMQYIWDSVWCQVVVNYICIIPTNLLHLRCKSIDVGIDPRSTYLEVLLCCAGWTDVFFCAKKKRPNVSKIFKSVSFLVSTKPITNVHHPTIHEDDCLFNCYVHATTTPQHHPFEKHNQISNTNLRIFLCGSGVQASSLAVMSKIFIKYKGVRKSRQFFRFLCCRKCGGKKRHKPINVRNSKQVVGKLSRKTLN